MKFGRDGVDSLLNKLWALYNIFHNGLIPKSLINVWASLGIIMFSLGSKSLRDILRSGVYEA